MAGLRSLPLSSVPHRCRGRLECCRGRRGCSRGGGRMVPPGETGCGGAELRTGWRRRARSPGSCVERARPWARATGGCEGGGPEGRGGSLGGSRCRRRRPPPPLLPARPQTRSLSLVGKLPAAGARSLLITSSLTAFSSAFSHAPPLPFFSPPPRGSPPSLLWQLNQQTRRTWGRGRGRRGAGGAGPGRDASRAAGGLEPS